METMRYYGYEFGAGSAYKTRDERRAPPKFRGFKRGMQASSATRALKKRRRQNRKNGRARR